MTLVDVRAGLRALLLGDSQISTAVGATRIYPVLLPQGTVLDSIVYTRITGQGDMTNDGPSWLVRPRIQIDVWSQQMTAAVRLANLVKERLEGFRGTLAFGSNSPQDEILFRGIFFEGEIDSYDDTAKLYRMSRDYSVWHAEK